MTQTLNDEPEVDESDSGKLDILNVGVGHIEFKFSTSDSDEAQQAKRAIEDMLARGYAIFIKLKDGTLKRVQRFDKNTGCYVIQEPVRDFPRRLAVRGMKACVLCKKAINQGDFYFDGGVNNKSHAKCGQPPPVLSRRRSYRTRQVPIHKAKATAVGRSAGG